MVSASFCWFWCWSTMKFTRIIQLVKQLLFTRVFLWMCYQVMKSPSVRWLSFRELSLRKTTQATSLYTRRPHRTTRTSSRSHLPVCSGDPRCFWSSLVISWLWFLLFTSVSWGCQAQKDSSGKDGSLLSRGERSSGQRLFPAGPRQQSGCPGWGGRLASRCRSEKPTGHSSIGVTSGKLNLKKKIITKCIAMYLKWV